MEHYLYAKSDDSLEYFADNKPYQFRVHLNTPLILKGFWKVSLVDFYAESSARGKNPDKFLLVYSDICKESLLSGNLRPILRRFPFTNKNQWNYSFDSDVYVPVKKHHIYEIEFYIKTSSDELATQLTEPVVLTLHFRHYPFYYDNNE